MLIIARVLQGLAGGGLLAKAQAILFETFSKEEQNAAQAIFGLGVMIGPAIGPTLGGYITDTIGDSQGAPGIGPGEPFNMQLAIKIRF